MNIEKYFSDTDVFQYKIIPSSEIPFSEDVIKMCEMNRCGKYGTCWTCPPGVGTLSELEKKIKSYENACVFTFKSDLEDSFDLEGMVKGQRHIKKVTREIADRMRLDGETFMVLGAEGCELCEKCTYPENPCRFPERAVPSIEACGIDVVSLSRRAEINYNNGENTVTYFSVILW